MSRWIIGMSGDKDAMIRHLEKCERRMLVQFAQIREVALTDTDHNSSVERIVEMCDVYVDKRSDRQKMQEQIDEMQEMIKKMEGDSECGCC